MIALSLACFVAQWNSYGAIWKMSYHTAYPCRECPAVYPGKNYIMSHNPKASSLGHWVYWVTVYPGSLWILIRQSLCFIGHYVFLGLCKARVCKSLNTCHCVSWVTWYPMGHCVSRITVYISRDCVVYSQVTAYPIDPGSLRILGYWPCSCFRILDPLHAWILHDIQRCPPVTIVFILHRFHLDTSMLFKLLLTSPYPNLIYTAAAKLIHANSQQQTVQNTNTEYKNSCT
jgi:hypothetical protein